MDTDGTPSRGLMQILPGEFDTGIKYTVNGDPITESVHSVEWSGDYARGGIVSEGAYRTAIHDETVLVPDHIYTNSSMWSMTSSRFRPSYSDVVLTMLREDSQRVDRLKEMAKRNLRQES